MKSSKFFIAIGLALSMLMRARLVEAVPPHPKLVTSVKIDSAGVAHVSLQFAHIETITTCNQFSFRSAFGHRFPYPTSETVQIRLKNGKEEARLWQVKRDSFGSELVFTTDEKKPFANGAYAFDLLFLDAAQFPLQLIQPWVEMTKPLHQGKVWIETETQAKLPQALVKFSGGNVQVGKMLKLAFQTIPFFAGSDYEVTWSNVKVGVSNSDADIKLFDPQMPEAKDLKAITECFKYFTGKVNAEGRIDLLPAVDTELLKEFTFSRSGGVQFTLNLVIKDKTGKPWFLSQPMTVSILPASKSLTAH